MKKSQMTEQIFELVKENVNCPPRGANLVYLETNKTLKTMLKSLAVLLTVICCSQFLVAQQPQKPSSSDIYHSIQKLNFLGTVLYVAAHPDDENTRLISYFSNEVHARTAYLALTRGDGGQNLIGPELREALGALRTQELLAARGVDGGEQYFSRANDFGFSKNPTETLKIWDKDKVLADVVWAIRKLQPDVIIDRFDHRTPGTTHGHHTASAMLAVEAFDLANDPKVYPDQLKYVKTWQPKRQFFNTSYWFYGGQEAFDKADKSGLLSVDTGVYYPMLGLSNNEIASMASSKHLCQGFGRLTVRGSEKEYMELINGKLPKDANDVFAGIDTSWSRIQGGAQIGAILNDVEAHFNFKNPSVHLSQLVKAYKMLQNVSDDYWKKQKSQELRDIILAVTGTYLEASAQKPYANPGETVNVNVEAINRSNADITLASVSFSPNSIGINNTPLTNNTEVSFPLELTVPDDADYSTAYWLRKKGSLGMYRVDDQKLIGLPETPAPFRCYFTLNIAGEFIKFSKPVIYRYSKPDKGERYQRFEILPKVSTHVLSDVILFAQPESKDVAVQVTAWADGVAGQLALDVPFDWTVSPESQSFSIAQHGDTKTLHFTVSPPKEESVGSIVPKATVGNKTYSDKLVQIDYDHIPKQYVLMPSESKVVRTNIQKVGQHVAYIMGAGDKVPESLQEMGYQVDMVDPASIEAGSLDHYDNVVVGIRAYNVLDNLPFKQQMLFDYVKQGGNMIVQYNTAGRWAPPKEGLAPYPLQLSQDRVTDENSEVKILAKDHPLVNFPNAITSKDFEGWVQERGLYFPTTWGKEFTPILSMHDDGESAKNGSLLVAPYGKGHYIYTGLSFFRELPAGVPGAYKLFANMLSLGKSKVEPKEHIKG